MAIETETLTAAEQLAQLPEPLQAQLWRIVRLAAGMSESEKNHFAASVAGCAQALALYGTDDAIAGAECLSGFALIVHEIGKGH